MSLTLIFQCFSLYKVGNIFTVVADRYFLNLLPFCDFP